MAEITLTIPLTIPDEMLRGVSEAELRQVLYDTYINYVTLKHHSDALEQMSLEAGATPGSQDAVMRNYAAALHKSWGKICASADGRWTMKKVE